MNEDIYFQKKAEEINDKIRSAYLVVSPKIDDIEKIIYLGLKEVARDQRYSCVDAAYIWGKLEGDINDKSSLYSVLQNAQIKGEQQCYQKL